MVDVCTLHSNKESDGLTVISMNAPDTLTETGCEYLYITHSSV